MTYDHPLLTALFTESVGTVPKISRARVIKPRKTAMLARVYKGETPVSFACEPKVDGVRVIITADLSTGRVSFASRNDSPLASLSHLASDVLALLHGRSGVWVLDGEAVSGQSFFTTVGDIRSTKSADDARVWLFDLPSVSGSYDERRAILAELFADANPVALMLIPSVACSPEEAYSTFTAEGFEGVMVKDRSAPYAHGIRSSSWLKLKDCDTEDAEIVDVVEGQGKAAGMAGHIVVRVGGRLVSVGTGMSDAVRYNLLARRSQLVGRVAEVDFQMMTPKGSLRHPVFVGVRGDK